MSSSFDPTAYYYIPKRDGPLEEYLKYHDGMTSYPWFKGYRFYQMLWNQGYFQPNISTLRLMQNVTEDKYFLVLDEKRIKGITDLPMHNAREGIYSAKEILSADWCRCFEVNNLSLEPVPRKKKPEIKDLDHKIKSL